jgi:hypothetical protein
MKRLTTPAAPLSPAAHDGDTDAIVLIKAAPQVGRRHGETVCCAAVDREGRWLRLYPVRFRQLEQAKRFGRWDIVRFHWRTPRDDARPESRRVEENSIEIVGKLKEGERQKFLAPLIRTSLRREREAGRTLALLNVEVLEFSWERRSEDEISRERSDFRAITLQTDLFNTRPLIPYEPSPYVFRYRYRCDDGERQGTCQDWEIDTTFFKWCRKYGEEAALERIHCVFGEDYPRKGMLLAMGTHSLYPDTWLINGVIRFDPVAQTSLF